MTEPERWQVSTDAAEVYESCFVPAIFGAWVGPVADAAVFAIGDRVLDVGCGTGVLAREALRRAELVRIEVKGSPLAEMTSDDAMNTLAAESESALAEFVIPSGEVVMPMDAHIVTAVKASF